MDYLEGIEPSIFLFYQSQLERKIQWGGTREDAADACLGINKMHLDDFNCFINLHNYIFKSIFVVAKLKKNSNKIEVFLSVY